MSWYYYEDRREAQGRVERELAKRRKAGEALKPVVPTASRNLSATFWGQAWNKNLLSYSDYESRMPRGRSYYRAGSVLDLTIASGQVTSVVQGTRIYDVLITIQPLPKARWEALRKRCQGQVGSLLELLSGKLSAQVMSEVTNQESGLFPSPKEIRFSCTCPDWATMCKHCAATLYAVGGKLDAEPALFFTLRGVDAQDLTGNASGAVAELTTPAVQAPERMAAIAGLDVCDVFGIELDDLSALAANEANAPAKKGGSRKAR